LAVAKVTVTAFPYSPVIFGLGLGVIWAGIALRWWCFRTLGHYFTFTVMTSANQPVITTGPYRILRHPSYAGILLVLAGIGISYGNWLSLAALIFLPLIGFINRIHVEEAALSATLGAAYTTYASSRKRLIPFVW
jgi:protein-S-isoprenylcysteine O-methyltransferase Ste14